MTTKKVLLGIGALALVVAAVSFVVKDKQLIPGDKPERVQLDKVWDDAVVAPYYIKYNGQEGKTAFELLKNLTTVESQQYDFGVFVKSINGVPSDQTRFWKLYVNGKESQVGADQVVTHDQDVIEWKFEEIK